MSEKPRTIRVRLCLNDLATLTTILHAVHTHRANSLNLESEARAEWYEHLFYTAQRQLETQLRAEQPEVSDG